MENESKSNANVAIIDLDIQDIEGIGPTTAKKLKDAGIISVMDLAVASAEELSESINATKETAASFIISAQKLLRETNVLDKEFVTDDAALQKRRSMLRCSTGSYALDDLLLEQIARSRGIDPTEILKNVAVCKVYNSSHLELIVKDLGKYIDDFKSKLVIIDSIISLHRAEFAGRGTLSDRQQRLNTMLHKIIRLAEIYNISVVITNQVQSSPDTFFGDPTKAAGGNILGHASTYRIYLRKSGENRSAKMIDSPYHPYS